MLINGHSHKSVSVKSKMDKFLTVVDPPSKKKARLDSGPDVPHQPSISSSSSTIKREECRYASNCYRRNEAHLQEYRHPLLEEVYRKMEECKDFTRFPQGIDVGDADETVLLEQAYILKEVGFQSELPVTQPPTRKSESLAASSTNHSTNTPTSINGALKVAKEPKAPSPLPSSSSSKKDSMADLLEERRQRMKQKFEASRRARESSQKQEEVEDDNTLPLRKSASVSKSLNTMADRWEQSCPFNFFLTKVRDIPREKNSLMSANFTDLFEPSLGDVKAVCHINFMVEANWFFDQSLRAGLSGKPTRVIYGEENPELQEGAKAFPSLKLFRVKSPFPYGHHHTKMSFVQYSDNSVRFFVYTANLIESDWDNRTQGIWISPRCPKVPPGSSSAVGESPTNFRSDIIQYLSTYSVQASAAWKDVIKYTDCSSIRVFFVGSAPITSQSSMNGFQFGIKKMEKILRSFEMDTEPNWQLTAQCSSIGTLGGSANDWLVNEFGAAMAGKDRTLVGPLKLVYPSDRNVKDSFDGVFGGGCLPYSAMTHMKQKWLNRHLCQWKADASGRSRAVPHIKSYSRWSPDQTKMAWFLLTSANLSKAAWGKLSKHRDRLTVMSWEAGVLFVPELFGPQKFFVPCNGNADNPRDALKFPLHIDVPLVKYEATDHPWFFETLQLEFSEKD